MVVHHKAISYLDHGLDQIMWTGGLVLTGPDLGQVGTTILITPMNSYLTKKLSD